MARPLRLQIANGIYHVVARGNERAPIFCDDVDRRSFLELLGEVGVEHRWRILTHCLMGNHFHLLVQTPVPNLSHGMRQLNGVYAQRFNRSHGRVGHLFQGRYAARLVQADGHLLAAVRYVVRNPVAAGHCSSPGGWPFSSHRAALGDAPPEFVDVDALLAYYGEPRERARARYRDHTEGREHDEPPSHPLVDGDESFVGRALAHVQATPGVPSRYVRPPRPSLDAVLGASQEAEALARARAAGYSLREIARYVGCNASTVGRRLRRSGLGATEAT